MQDHILYNIYSFLPFQYMVRDWGNDVKFILNYPNFPRFNIPTSLRLYACKYDKVELLKWICDKYGKKDSVISGVFESATHNSRECLEYLITFSSDACELALQGASAGGKLELAFWIVDHYDITGWDHALFYACFYEQTQMIEWLIIQGARKCSNCNFLKHLSFLKLI